MGCGSGLMRTILVIFNTLFLLGGLAGLGGGIWMAVSPGSLFKFIKESFTGSAAFVNYSAYTLIGASCLIILVAGLGCFGACARNRCALGTYAAFMIIILIIQIAAIVLVVVFDQKFSDDFTKEAGVQLNKGLEKSLDDGDSSLKDAIEKVQEEYKCCGVNGVTDYSAAVLLKTTGLKGCGAYPTKGCYQAIKDWVKSHLGVVIGISVAIIMFQVILFIFACCLCRSEEFINKMA